MERTRLTPEDLVSRTADLVSLRDIFIRLKTVVDDPESSMADVAQVVASDPALTARLLKIAISPFFGFPARITTVAQAASLLGTQQIHDLVLATTVAEAFSGIPTDIISMQNFWSHSIRCGLLARRVAQREDRLAGLGFWDQGRYGAFLDCNVPPTSFQDAAHLLLC
jgi:HD-like signal output (HDOD) protein